MRQAERVAIPSGPSSPRRLVEAEQLERFSHGLQGVRAIVRRETIGVDHPVRQLGALDQTIVTYQRAIGQLDRRLHDPAVPTASVQDWLALISSLVELIYTAYYWLQVARIVRRLPSYPPGGPLLSTERSRQRRSDAVAEIAIARSRAIDLMGRLIRVLQAQNPDAARVLKTLFENEIIQIRCAGNPGLRAHAQNGCGFSALWAARSGAFDAVDET
jgi:hypothetical protein